jgi:hypothetical protein
VNNRVEPAVDHIEGEKKVYPGKAFRREATRFEAAPDEILAGKLEQLIPPDVAAAVRRAVKTYGDDTKTLLRDIYLTPPMLNAAPGEELDFSTAAKPRAAETATPRAISDSRVEAASPETDRQRLFPVNQRKRITAEAGRRLNASIARRTVKSSKTSEPRYDDVFLEGVLWLDRLAGQPMHESESGELHFTEGVWKDPARTDSGT